MADPWRLPFFLWLLELEDSISAMHHSSRKLRRCPLPGQALGG